MAWLILVFGAFIGCLCGMAVYNMIEEQKEKIAQRKQERK